MFKTRVLAWLAMMVVAAAGAWAQDKPDREPIDVEVINGQISVAEEEARTNRNQGGIVWRMVTPGYRFPSNGIVIDSSGKHRCAVVANGQRYRCAKLRHDAGERYKYIVNAVVESSGQSLTPLDPWIVND